MIWFWFLFGVVWVSCGMLAHGYMLAWCAANDRGFFREWYRAHFAGCLGCGLCFGPWGSFLVWVIDLTRHGWRFW